MNRWPLSRALLGLGVVVSVSAPVAASAVTAGSRSTVLAVGSLSEASNPLGPVVAAAGSVASGVTNAATGGSVSGHLVAYSPGPDGTAHGIAGKVVIEDHNGVTFSTNVGNNGHFSVHIPAGTYQVTGNGATVPGITCSANRTVTVHPTQAVTGISVVCPYPG
jgi:hypothetical protein